MTFDDLIGSTDVFLDANAFVYHFTSDPHYGAACTRLLERIELQECNGFTATHVLADVAHRLMTIEAMVLLGWPVTRLAARLRKHHAEISQARGLSAGVGQNHTNWNPGVAGHTTTCLSRSPTQSSS